MKVKLPVWWIVALLSGCDINFGGHHGMMHGSDRKSNENAAFGNGEASYGYVLVSDYCTQCHDRPDPAIHTAYEWETVIIKMKNYMRITNKREPTPGEWEHIIDFLEKNAKAAE